MSENRLKSLLSTFLIIGTTSFGGYMALIAIIRRNMVERDAIISDEILTEGISLASFLPGPMAVNVVAYIGYKLSGVTGAFLSVVAVLLPSFLLVCVCSFLYFEFGEIFSFDGILLGIVPAIIGIIISVGVSMAKKVCVRWIHYLIATGSFIILFFFSGYWSIVTVLLLTGIIGVLTEYKSQVPTVKKTVKFSTSLISLGVLLTLVFLVASYVFPDHLFAKLFTTFSAVSLTLFGGGYVMVPILKSILVDQLAWFNYKEFVFGISIGQVTPGPILISSAFFGYKMAGIAGAIISTIAIFFPSSLLMIGASEAYQKVKENRLFQAGLVGVKPAVVGLIFYSGASLFIKHIEFFNIWISLGILVVSVIAIFKFNTQTAIVVLLSGVLGYLVNYFIS